MEVTNLNYKIKNKIILNDINLKFDKNGIYTIIGPNGSGKTTFLNILNKTIEKTSGEILINNQKIETIKNKDFYKILSSMSQHQNIFHKIDVEYFLKLNRYIVTKSLTIDEKTEEIIEIFKLKPFLNQLLTTLSGGELQRVILASVFLLETKYILLDEPFTYIDIGIQIELSEIIYKYFAQKHIIIMSSHSINFFEYSNSVIALKNGKIFFNTDCVTKNHIIDLFNIPNNLQLF